MEYKRITLFLLGFICGTGGYMIYNLGSLGRGFSVIGITIIALVFLWEDMKDVKADLGGKHG